MPRLASPWQWRAKPTGERMLVFASRFDGRGQRFARTLLSGGGRVRKQVLASPGALGVSIYARPLRGKYYTLSAWADEESLRAFARSGGPHAEAIRELRNRGAVTGVLISWWQPASAGAPTWDDALRRIEASPPGPYAGPMN